MIEEDQSFLVHHSDVEYDNNINRENSQSSKHTTQPYITLIHTFTHSHIHIYHIPVYVRIRTIEVHQAVLI